MTIKTATLSILKHYFSSTGPAVLVATPPAARVLHSPAGFYCETQSGCIDMSLNRQSRVAVQLEALTVCVSLCSPCYTYKYSLGHNCINVKSHIPSSIPPSIIQTAFSSTQGTSLFLLENVCI